jgi:hypothetical protein
MIEERNKIHWILTKNSRPDVMHSAVRVAESSHADSVACFLRPNPPIACASIIVAKCQNAYSTSKLLEKQTEVPNLSAFCAFILPPNRILPWLEQCCRILSSGFATMYIRSRFPSLQRAIISCRDPRIAASRPSSFFNKKGMIGYQELARLVAWHSL